MRAGGPPTAGDPLRPGAEPEERTEPLTEHLAGSRAREQAARFASTVMARQPQEGGPFPVASLQLSLPHLQVTVEATAQGIDEYVQTVRKRLKRKRISCEPAFAAEVGGNPDGRGQWLTPGRDRQRRQLQLYAVSGGVAVMLTAAQADVGYLQAAGPVQLAHPPVPALLPLVRLPAAEASAVGQKITLVQQAGPAKGIKLSATVGAQPWAGSADAFAAESLDRIRRRLPDLAISDPEADTFLGGHYCVRRTLLHSSASLRAATQNEYWWAGIVAGHGVQVFALGLNSIIDLPPAAWLRDLIMPVPAG